MDLDVILAVLGVQPVIPAMPGNALLEFWLFVAAVLVSGMPVAVVELGRDVRDAVDGTVSGVKLWKKIFFYNWTSVGKCPEIKKVHNTVISLLHVFGMNSIWRVINLVKCVKYIVSFVTESVVRVTTTGKAKWK